MPQKYEREIDEILRRMDGPLPTKARRQRVWEWLAGLQPWLDLRLTPGRLMAAGLVLALLSYLLRAPSPALAAPAAIASLVLFVSALVVSVVRRRRQQRPMWRGRHIDDWSARGTVWEEVARRWRNWRRTRRRG